MERYPKKDRDEALRILDIEAEDGRTPNENIQNMLCVIFDKSQRMRLDNYKIVSNLSSSETFFTEVAVIERVAFNNLEGFLSHFKVGVRLCYLTQLIGGTKYSGTDCIHVWDMLKALAINDTDTVNAFTEQFPAPFNNGHKVIILISNAVYTVLGKQPVTDDIIYKLNNTNSSKFYMAIFRSLAAMLTNDIESFLENISNIVKLNRRQQDFQSMEKLISIYAHGLVNLWQFHTNNSPLPELNFPMPWDCSLHNYIKSNKQINLISFENISKEFNRWLHDTPAQINVDELVNELKENCDKFNFSSQ